VSVKSDSENGGYKSGTDFEASGYLNESETESLAERVGFEPTVAFPLHSLSRRALSTAQTPLRGRSILSLTKAHYPNNLG
jgi:hypothetical protein